MKTRTLHKSLSMLLTVAMALNMGLTPVFAEGVPLGASGQTECHTKHDDTCGYTETVTVTSPCTHTCEVCEVLEGGAHARATGVSSASELLAAVAVATNGATISLGNGFEFAGTDANPNLTIDGKAITLDLNGQTLTLGENSRIRVNVTGGLTLSDSSGDGKLTGVNDGIIINEGQLTITGGTVENTQATAIKNSGTLSITGGEVKATQISTAALENMDSGSITVGGNAKIFGEGSAIESGFSSTGTITVEGNVTVTATNTSEYCTAISNGGTGTVNIKGGTVQNVVGGSVVYNGNTGTINVSGGEIIAHELNGGRPAATINNTSIGTINVTAGKLTAHGNGNGYAIRNDATDEATGDSNPAGEVNVTGGELVTTGKDSVTILSTSGKLTVGGNAIVRATGDGGTAIKSSDEDATVDGSAVVEATGGMLESLDGPLSPRAIFSDGTLTAGDNAQVRATGEGGMAVVNNGDFKLEDRAILEATGNLAGQLLGGGALANFKTATINGGIMRVTQPGGIAVFNFSELTINGGTVGRVELYGNNATTYVYGQVTPSAEPTGVPVLIGDSDYRIKVTLPSVGDIASMRSNVTLAGATLPDENDPLAFFELELQTDIGVPTTLPTGMQLLLPFPLGTDDESNNYTVAHFANSATNAPDIHDASGLVGGILCEPESLSPFMPMKFVRHQVALDANGGTVELDRLGVKLDGKLDFEKYRLTELPTPTHSSYGFKGWFTEKSGGTKVMIDDVYTADTTIFAQWSATPATTFTITFDANGGTLTTASAKTDADGKLSLDALPTPERDGYVFNGWFTADTSGTKVTIDQIYFRNTTIYAQWSASGGGDNGGGGSGSSNSDKSTPPATTTPEGGKLVVNAQTDKDGNFIFNLPKTLQDKLIAEKTASFTIRGGGLFITLDLEAIKHIRVTANADVLVSATRVNNSALSAEAQAAIGNRPVYDFKVTGGGKNITTFGNGKISIGIPYELQRVDANGKKSDSGSFENPGSLVGVYVDTNGKLIYLAGSSYNTTSKTMRLSTDHLSLYGVAYQTNAPTFTDTANHWAKDDIQFVVARGLLTGTGGNQFSPDGEMTRGMFVTVLGRLANADVSGYKTGSFSDVATESYYLGYVEWAVKNKIATGTSATTFAPDRAISREEMAVMLQSYTRAMGYRLPNVHPAIVFTDNTTIAPWAQTAVKEMQMAGILYGRDGGKFAPNGTATRGEASAMLRRFVELVINGTTV